MINYKVSMGCKGDRIKVHFNGDGLVARNGRHIKTADGLLMKLDGEGYIVFPYGRLHKGIKLEDLGKTRVRWNHHVDRWDINIASTRAQASPIITDRLTDHEKLGIKVITKKHFLHSKAYVDQPCRSINGVKPYACELAEVMKKNDELYTWIDNKYKEFVYSLDEDQRESVIGIGLSSGFKFTIKGGRSKTLECVRSLFDGDDVYAFVNDEDDYVRLIPAELIDSPIIYKDADGYFTKVRTAKELTSLMENAKVFARSEDIVDGLKYGIKNYTGSFGDVSIKGIIDIIDDFAWSREIGYWLRSSNDNTMLISTRNVFDDSIHIDKK